MLRKFERGKGAIINFKPFLSRLCVFYMLSLLSCPLVFAQAENCSFSDSEIEGVEIGQIGDRQIYTLFTLHIFNEPSEIQTVMGSYRPMDAAILLDQLIERSQERIESEQSDVQKIIELVGSGQIDWIGVERSKAYTSYIDNATDNYLKDRDFINFYFQFLPELDANKIPQLLFLLYPAYSIARMYFQFLPEWTANKTTQLLFLFYPAYIIARANHPEDFRRARIYPLEDELLEEESFDRANDYLYYDKLVREDPHVTLHQYSSVNSFIENAMIPRLRLITESEFENLLNRLGVPEEPRMTRVRMRRLIMVHNDTISLALKRDKAAVQSILDIPGNGLILFGTAHGPGIKQGLITACQKGNSSL